jgi:hypothetical protein
MPVVHIWPFVCRRQMRENGKQNEIPQAINYTTVNIGRHITLLFHKPSNTPFIKLSVGSENECASSPFGDVDRYVIIREFMKSMLSIFSTFIRP